MNENPSQGRLILKDGKTFTGHSFGAQVSAAGEVVFNTGNVGYPESLTDPSYFGQILVLTSPLIGNYGVPPDNVENGISRYLESSRLQIAGLIISDYSDEYSHWNSSRSLSDWLVQNDIPALSGIDTRALTRRLREKGTVPGKILFGGEKMAYFNPDHHNLVEKVSIEQPVEYGSGPLRIGLLDCGCKFNIIRSLLKRGVQVVRVPWNFEIQKIEINGLLISNGPGNPKQCRQTINQIRQAMERNLPERWRIPSLVS
ncbi:MAG: carbamoyl phosphate synthase small subunit, partial [Calditrichia bacterium]